MGIIAVEGTDYFNIGDSVNSVGGSAYEISVVGKYVFISSQSVIRFR